MNSNRSKNCILIVIVSILYIVCSAFCFLYADNFAISYAFDINQIDPYYPVSPSDVPFTLKAPTLENRFTYSNDKTTASLFAPYTNKDLGWKDANKTYENDMNLCWAASDSNLISWYLDVYAKLNISDLTGIIRDENDIFNVFKDNWNETVGFDDAFGLSWYFTGKFPDNQIPWHLENKSSGGYLKSLAHVPQDGAFYILVPELDIYGNSNEKFPFIDIDKQNYMDMQSSPLGTLENFSKTILKQLLYGAVGLTIGAEHSSSTGTHAVTLWGADYDVNTGLINYLYITDNSDNTRDANTNEISKTLHKIPVTKDEDGFVKINHQANAYDAHDPMKPEKFVKITDSFVLYAPGVVSTGDDEQTPPDPTPTPPAPTPCIPEKVTTPATCQTYGVQDYWYCKETKSYYEDEQMQHLIVDIETWKKSHKIDKLQHIGKIVNDDIYHWKVCEQCGEIYDKEKHIYSDWVIVKEPTETETGIKERTCLTCGYKQIEIIDMLQPSINGEEVENKLEPTEQNTPLIIGLSVGIPIGCIMIVIISIILIKKLK